MRTSNVNSLINSVVWIVMILILMACTGQNDSPGSDDEVYSELSEDPSKQSIISFISLSHDFGTIIEGEMVVCYFDYENSGENDLVINSVEATCGCTTPDWSSEPLQPGEKEKLKIIFDASGRSGQQQKVVTVSSNASNSTIKLTVKANVKSSVN